MVQVDNDGTIVSQGQDYGDSSSSDDEDGTDANEDTAMGDAQKAERQPVGPVIDEDGFQLVQKRRPRGRAGQGG